MQNVIDSQLQRPGLEQQQRGKSVEQSLKGIRQAALLVCHKSGRKLVVCEQLDGDVGESLAHHHHASQWKQRVVWLWKLHCREGLINTLLSASVRN